MTEGEYRELVEFMAPKFDAIGAQFDAIGAQFDAMGARFDAIEIRLVRVEVGQEQQAGQIQLLAEGLGSFREEVERRFEQVEERFDARFDAHDALVRDLFTNHERRLGDVEAQIRRPRRS